MAFPYGRSHQQYSPLGGGTDPNVIYQSPIPLQGPFDSSAPPNPYDGSFNSTPNLGSPPMEMFGRPNAVHRQSGASLSSFSSPPLPSRPGAHPMQHDLNSTGSQSTLFGGPNHGRWSTQSSKKTCSVSVILLISESQRSHSPS